MRSGSSLSALCTLMFSICFLLSSRATAFQSTTTEPTPQSPIADGSLAGWGRAEDPAQDCRFQIDGGKLLVKVPGTHHALNPSPRNKNLLAPRVLQDIVGDFTVQVKLRCFDPPAGGSSTNPVSATDTFVGAGILIWQDEKNFFRLVQGAFTGQQPQRIVQCRVGNQLMFQEVYNFDAEYLYLRVSRIGTTFSYAVSEDGQRWLTPGVVKLPAFVAATRSMPDALRAGVLVVNSVNQELEAQFDELKVSNSPEYATHDAFKLNLVFPRNPMTELSDRRVQQELKIDKQRLLVIDEYLQQRRALPTANLSSDDNKSAIEIASKAWAAIEPTLSAQQRERLAGLSVQRFGPRSLLLELVQQQLKLTDDELQNIARARELLIESVAMRKPAMTPELESAYRDLRQQANALLTSVAQGAVGQRMHAISGELFAFSLPGSVVPSELGRNHPAGPLAELICQPAVQQELKLSRGTVEVIDKFMNSKSRQVLDSFASLELDASGDPQAPATKAWAEAYQKVGAMRLEVEQECKTWLSPEQNTRLQQILFQALGPQTLLVSETARDALKITSEQREALQRIEQDLAKSQNFSHLIFSSQRKSEVTEQLLTEEQHQRLETLKGPAFYFLPVSR